MRKLLQEDFKNTKNVIFIEVGLKALFRHQRQQTQNTCTYWSEHVLTCHHNTTYLQHELNNSLCVFL